MNAELFKALESKYKAQRTIAKTNLKLYLSDPVAVADHPDMVDTIDKLSKFTFPERINNDYKVNIVNTNIKDKKLKDKIEERIEKELHKITPYYDTAKEININ